MSCDNLWPTKVGEVVPGDLDAKSPEFIKWASNPRLAIRKPLPGWKLVAVIRGYTTAASSFCGSTMPVNTNYFLPAGAPPRPEPWPAIGTGPDGSRYLHLDEGYVEFWTACEREGLDVSNVETWGPGRENGADSIAAWLRAARQNKLQALEAARARDARNEAVEADWISDVAAWCNSQR